MSKCAKCGKKSQPPYLRLGGREGESYCLSCGLPEPPVKLDGLTEEAIEEEIEVRKEKALDFKKAKAGIPKKGKAKSG